jgi:type IV pilus assembly protein PilN
MDGMRLRLNLATNPLETQRRFLVGSGLVAFFAAVVFLWLGWHVYTVRKVDEEFRTRTEKTRQEMAKLEVQRQELDRFFHQEENAKLHDRAAFINGILDARSFNWTQMFMDLEHVLPAGVRVISIEPKQVGSHVEVKLNVGAASDEAALKFLHALEASKEFTEVQVQTFAAQTTGPQSSDQKVLHLTTVYSRT